MYPLALGVGSKEKEKWKGEAQGPLTNEAHTQVGEKPQHLNGLQIKAKH